MDPSQTSVWDHAFNSSWMLVSIAPKTTNFLLKVKFDGESEVPIIDHLIIFE